MSKKQAGMGLQAVGMIVAIVGNVYGGQVGYIMMAMGAAMAVTGGTIQSSIKPKVSRNNQGQLMNFRSSRQPLPLLYGEFETGCNKTFYHVANPYLHIICELGEGQIEGIKRQDGTMWTTTATELPRDNPPLVYLDRKLWTDYVWYGLHNNGRKNPEDPHYVYAEFFDGSSTQNVCATLQAASGGKWNEALRRTAYIYIRLEFNIDCFKQEPDITALVRGLKIYNPVTATTAWTANPALHAYDMITRSSQRGGIGISTSRIDLTALDAAIDYCDVKPWTCNLPISEQAAASDNLEQILACFRGAVINSDTGFKIKFLDLNYETSVMDLTEDDVAADTLRISADYKDRPNAVKATYLDPKNNFKANDYVFTDPAAIAAEGDYREIAVDLLGLSDIGLVQKMSNYVLERSRLQKNVGFVSGESALSIEPLDLIRLTHSRPGWTQRLLRVLTPTISGAHTVSLALTDEALTLYDDTYNLTDQDYHDTDLIDPSADPPDVINAALTEEVYFYRNRSFTRLLITFEPPANYPWFDHVEIWISTDGDNFKHQFNARSSCSLDPVNEGQRFWVRLRTVNVFGRRQDEDTAILLSKMINGKTAAPSDLSGMSAIPSGDTVILAANPVDDPDIVGYEVRIGNSWAGGIFLAFNLDSRMTLSNVKPGTHTFWMAAKDNAGNYSANPVSATVTVYMPAGFTLADSWSWNFDGVGVHDNTEHAVYSAQDALKCCHTGDVLTGVWTSPEYDLGSIMVVRTFGDFITAFVDPTGNFSSIWGADNTFADVDPLALKTFSQLYLQQAAGVLRARLKWGDTSGSLTNSLDWFEISAAEISGRYIQVVVTLTDPALDANLYLYQLNMLAYTF